MKLPLACFLAFMGIATMIAQENGGTPLIERSVPEVSVPDSVNHIGSDSIISLIGSSTSGIDDVMLPHFEELNASPDSLGAMHEEMDTAESYAMRTIWRWRNVSLWGAVNAEAYPGMMGMETGSFGVSYHFQKFYFELKGIVNKYAFYNGLMRQIGIGGSLTYVLSSSWSATAYGNYYFNNGRNSAELAMRPSMLGFYETSRYGGYVNYSGDGPFGIIMGGQVVERFGHTTHYEFEPVVTPYVKAGKGKKKIGIGLPIGQILHGLLRR